MDKFTVHTGTTLAIMNDNIDTDQLLPKQFLKRLTKKGYEDALFFEWRYKEDGSNNPDFILNDPERQDASILITGDSFGIGSSREHAVWALRDWGFKAVIAGSFGPILYMNCTKNGVLPIELPKEARETLSKLTPTEQVTIDLPKQEVPRRSVINSSRPSPRYFSRASCFQGRMQPKRTSWSQWVW